MSGDGKRQGPALEGKWLRIPDGTRVRHREEGHEGTIDGLTEIVQGIDLNPDGRTQYRVNVGGAVGRKLAAESELLILSGEDGLVIMDKKVKLEYRRIVTEQLHVTFAQDRFVAPL